MFKARHLRFDLLRRLTGLPAVAVLLAFGSLPAHANTYLFSFTGSDILAALETSQTTAVVQESAYYAIFLQPSVAAISSYSYSLLGSPNSTDTNAWETNVVTDPSNVYFGYSSGSPCSVGCSWAEFGKIAAATNVTVLSEANGGALGANIFNGTRWRGLAPPLGLATPYGWGTTRGLIDTIMPTTDVFSITIDTTDTLSGYYTFIGRASSLKSGDPSTMTADEKEIDGISFSVSGYIAPAPEPETWGFMVLGLAAITVGRLRLRRSSR